MNMSGVVKGAVAVVKNVAASESAKAVGAVVKTVAYKALGGIGIGAGIGATIAGIKIGYKLGKKGVEGAGGPIVEALDKMATGEPQFTVTFRAEETKKETETATEEANNSDNVQKPEEPVQE